MRAVRPEQSGESAPAAWRIHFVRERHRASCRGGGIIPPFLCPPTAARSQLVCRLANRDDIPTTLRVHPPVADRAREFHRSAIAMRVVDEKVTREVFQV